MNNAEAMKRSKQEAMEFLNAEEVSDGTYTYLSNGIKYSVTESAVVILGLCFEWGGVDGYQKWLAGDFRKLIG